MTKLEKKLMAQIEQLTIQNQKQAQMLENLMNQIANLNRRTFGTKSEQNQNQLSIFDDEDSHPFNEAEQTAEKTVDTETITYRRKKYKRLGQNYL